LAVTAHFAQQRALACQELFALRTLARARSRMSITKNTRRRKKVVPRGEPSASQAKPQANPPPVSQEAAAPNRQRDIKDEVSHLLSRVSPKRRLAYAALFHAAMQELRVAWRKPSARRRRQVAEFLNNLQQESSNRRYRHIMRALAKAAEEGDEAMKEAYATARLAVEQVFEWSEDYRFVFGDYKPKRKPTRQSSGKASAAKRTKK
jgi:hypothetical protein